MSVAAFFVRQDYLQGVQVDGMMSQIIRNITTKIPDSQVEECLLPFHPSFLPPIHAVAYRGFVVGGWGGGFQQIQLRTENGDLGAVAP
jgi:hypothetical protein